MKEIITLNWNAVQQMCIDNELYTRGDCNAFDQLRGFVNSIDHITAEHYVEIIQEIAQDIFEHSDLHMGLTDIMSALARRCNRWFE